MALRALAWDLPLPPETQELLDDSRRLTQKHEKVFSRPVAKYADDHFIQFQAMLNHFKGI
jgi:hypothetical protein